MNLDVLKSSDFQGIVGKNLPVRFEPNVILEAQVLQVKEFNNYSPIERKPFSIELRTSQKEAYYTQGIYTINHPEKGDLDIFLVPVGFDTKGMKYEAVFS